MDEPNEIWQSQKTEAARRSTQFFRMKAARQREKLRWTNMANDAVFIFLIAFLAYVFGRISNPASRGGLVLLAAGCIYGIWRRHRWTPLPQAPLTGIEAYVLELRRSREDTLDMWRVMAPLLPGAILFAIPLIAANPRGLVKALPFCLLLGVWFLLAFPVYRRKLRAIELEIDMLKKMERD